MRRLLICTIMLGMVLLAVAPCFAENALSKLGRGLVNGATGFCEYPKQIVETSKEHNAAVGLTWGQLKGVGMGVARHALGAYDTATFYLPPYDKPVLEPETVFQ
ncbi:MAG: exosortase system-associated protein, TIGR04073 family [Candidatus Omnitrophica bacterium]|nr:exosortase system-associated protein, TIGR04073 family [Candidatus Omnitrophota bacterium]